jgi:hypothetical protein
VQTLTVILRQQPILNTHACTLVVVPSRGVSLSLRTEKGGLKGLTLTIQYI